MSQEQILTVLKSKKEMTRKELEIELNLGKIAIYNALSSLLKYNEIERIETDDRKPKYRIKK